MLFADKKIKLTVVGMHCNHCKATVEKAAMSVEGVKTAVADPKTDSLVVKVDKNADNSLAQAVAEAVTNSGFKATVA